MSRHRREDPLDAFKAEHPEIFTAGSSVSMIQYYDANRELLGEPVLGTGPSAETAPRGAAYWRVIMLFTPAKPDAGA